MADDPKPVKPAAVDAAKRAIAEEIYTTWRNKHMNDAPTAFFNRLQDASESLINAIAARL